MYKVAVIVPVYNMSPYLERCISSVLQQTYREFCLIIIDDGSTDDSLQKCLRLTAGDKRVQVVHQDNAGLGPSRNRGIMLADTEYVTFLDADDWWSDDYLENMMRGTEEGRNDIVLCDMDFATVDAGGGFTHKTSRLRFVPGRLDIAREKNLLNKARTFMCGKLYRRSLFIDYGIEISAKAYEDVATTPYLMSKAKGIFYVDKPLYHYFRNRQGSIVNNFSKLADLIDALKMLRNSFFADNSYAEYLPQLRYLFWCQLCFIYRVLNGKFSAGDLDARRTVCNRAEKAVLEAFPELQALFAIRLDCQDSMLKQAYRLIALPQDNYLDDGQIIIYTLCFKDVDNVADNVITIAKPSNDEVVDEESFLWNLADEIFFAIMAKIIGD